jgi:hypothetical protein
MAMNHEEVERFLVQPRISRAEEEARAKRVGDFLSERHGFKSVKVVPRGVGKAGIDIGSCTAFSMSFNEQWQLLEPQAAHATAFGCFRVDFFVSCRGPLVASSGWRWSVGVEGRDEPYVVGRPCVVQDEAAAAKAQRIAQSVASEFAWAYLSATNCDELRGRSLDPKSPPSDVTLSLDDSDPNMLNVLFDEDL